MAALAAPSGWNQIVENIFFSPFVRIADLPGQLHDLPHSEADVDRLVQAGILKELENATPKTFYAPLLAFDVAYEQLE